MATVHGRLIEFEGIDGSGKLTQATLLQDRLLKRGGSVSLYSYPDYRSEYGQRIKSFLAGDIHLTGEEQFLLYMLDIVKDKPYVREGLQSNEFVVMDRYYISTIAYQCVNGVDYARAKKLVKLMELPTPSVVFYLDIPPSVSLARKRREKGTGDRFEEDSRLLGGVSLLYDRLMRDRFPTANWIRLDGMEQPEAIHERVFAAVEKMDSE